MDANLVFFSVLALILIAVIILYVKIFSLSRRITDLFGNKKRDSVEKVLNEYVKGVKQYFSDVNELKDFSHRLYQIGERSIQKIGFIRFNPFDDVGGDQSFSIALLDLKNSGILITSLFGREGTRIYSKLVQNGKSESFLSEEEKKALDKATKIKGV